MARAKYSITLGKLVGGLFAVLATMTVSAIYHSDTTLASASFHSFFRNAILVLSCSAAILSVPLINIKSLNMGVILAIGTVIIFTFINLFHSYESQYNGVLLFIQWVTFCLLPSDVKKYAFDVFKKIWVVVCIIGIICYLCYILKLPVPYKVVPYYFLNGSQTYISYGISFLYKHNDMLRLCGICNEPGYLGTFCALKLCADKMNLKNKSNIIILFAGLLTFSAAFYLIVVVYLAVRMILVAHRSKNAKKKILYYIGIALAVLCYFVVLPNIHTGNTSIDNTLHRLTISSEGLAGDNRTTKQFESLYDSVMATDALFGKGAGYVSKETDGGSLSYKMKLVEYGIIGCMLIWGTLLCAVLYKNTKNKDIVLFIVVFFASIYQRPNIITLPYLLLLLGGIWHIKSIGITDNSMATENEHV